MRLGRAAIWIIAFGFAGFLALTPRARDARVWAQIGAPPAPLPAPALPPGVVVTPAAIPTLAPIPIKPPVAMASPSPTPRSFQCSCFGPASSVRWMGSVQSQGYFQARQAAVNACLAYNFSRRPGTAYVPPSSFSFFPTPAPPLGSLETEPGLPNLQAPGISGFSLLLSPRGAILLQLCSECACN